MKKFLLINSMLLFILLGCKDKKTSSTDINQIDLIINSTNKSTNDNSSDFQRWNISNKRIVVLFGYDFNVEKIQSGLLNILKTKYGLDEDGGLIIPYTFPDSFKHNGKSFASEFPSEVNKNENDICGIVLLGAPEGTELALSRIRDFWKLDVPYPIIALFSQEESDGLEANCDIVIDKAQKAEITGSITSEETITEVTKDSNEILCDTIDYILSLNGSIPKDLKKNEIKDHAKQMLKNRELTQYQDPDTGLISINHFILR